MYSYTPHFWAKELDEMCLNLKFSILSQSLLHLYSHFSMSYKIYFLASLLQGKNEMQFLNIHLKQADDNVRKEQK